MKFDLSNWVDRDFYGRKLPKSEDIESFFDCLSTEPETHSFFETIPNHNYTVPQQTYRRSEIYPVLVSNPSISYSRNTWVTPALLNCELNPHKENGPRRLPALAFQLDPETIRRVARIPSEYCMAKEMVIKSTREMSSIKSNILNQSNHNASLEIQEFKKNLKDKKYIQFLSHQEILSKVIKLREMFPFEPIYILADEDLLDYLYVHCKYEEGQPLKNVWLIKNAQDRFTSTHTDIFLGYKSAVFTIADMKGSHNFEFHYNYQRGNRIWKIFIATIFNLNFDIPEDPLEKELVSIENVSTTKSNLRWDNLL